MKVIVFLIIGLFIGAGVSTGIPIKILKNENISVGNTVEEKKWTWLFYNDADFFLGFDPMDSFSEYAYSSKNLNVVVLQDTFGKPAKLWYIDESHDKMLLENMGEVDMGDYQTLADFIAYGVNNYPADRYLLSFYDHGSGWQGACIDNTDGGMLSMDEMQKAISDNDCVDIVCFTAPCLMGSIESVYELRDCTDVFIGGEPTSGYCWWWYVIDDMCDIMDQNPSIDTLEFGSQIINIIEEECENWVGNPNIDENNLQMTAIRTDKISTLVQDIDEIAQIFLENHELFYDNFWSVYDNIQSLIENEIIDLYDFLEKSVDISPDQTFSEKLEEAKKSFNEAVIAECHGLNHTELHGLSIYFPKDKKTYISAYGNDGYGLDFSRYTQWDEFLDEYMKIKRKNHFQINQFFNHNFQFVPLLQ
jgi:hypothetical protein